MFVTVFGNFQQVYLYFERSILFGNLSQQWDDDLVGVPTTNDFQKEKVFALIPNTPGAHSICVHCAARDPTQGLAAGYVSYVSSFFLGGFGEGGWVWLFLGRFAVRNKTRSYHVSSWIISWNITAEDTSCIIRKKLSRYHHCESWMHDVLSLVCNIKFPWEFFAFAFVAFKMATKQQEPSHASTNTETGRTWAKLHERGCVCIETMEITTEKWWFLTSGYCSLPP